MFHSPHLNTMDKFENLGSFVDDHTLQIWLITSSWCCLSCSFIPNISCKVGLSLACYYIQAQYFRLDDLVGGHDGCVLPFLPHPGHVMSGCPNSYDVSLVPP